jgi:hypothetical protein
MLSEEKNRDKNFKIVRLLTQKQANKKNGAVKSSSVALKLKHSILLGISADSAPAFEFGTHARHSHHR